MPLYQPSELHQFLAEIGAKPKKGLSQNFLVDGNILKKIVAAAHLKKGETVIEIGPGPGVLTEALLGSGVHVIAIEKDEKLARHLQRLQNGNLKVLTDDFRNQSIKSLLPTNAKGKIIANIPYHLTGLILRSLLPENGAIASIHLLIQKEVANRCIASPRTKDYSSLTLFTEYHSAAKLLFPVPKKCFYPSPKVDSAVLELTLQKPPVDSPYLPLFHLIRTSFQMRRKMLRTSLKKIASPPAVERALLAIGLPKNSRPQELTLAHFSALFRALNGKEKEQS